VTFAGGIVQVPLKELPQSLQEQYHYNSSAAAKFLLEKKRKSDKSRADNAARQAAYEKSLSALVGQYRKIQISAIIDETSNGGFPLCSIGYGGVGGGGDGHPVPSRILLKNLSAEVRDFLRRYNQLQNDILTFGEKVHNDEKAADRANALALVGVVGGETAYDEAAMAQRKQANLMALDVKEEGYRLKQMQDELEQMASNAIEKTSIMACPTGQTFGSYEIWTCGGN
jgi:hypothetical protein